MIILLVTSVTIMICYKPFHCMKEYVAATLAQSVKAFASILEECLVFESRSPQM